MISSWERPSGVGLRLVLIRHGEPEASAAGRCYGKLDVGLSAVGRRQMRLLAEKLEAAGIDAFYTSPRRRARESAEILSDEMIVDRRFSEIDFGDLEGLTYEEAAEQYPHLYERWMREPTAVKFPGGESFDEMRRRVLEAASVVREVHLNRTVAIVSHGGVNRILLSDALGIEPRDIFHMDQSHAGVSVIDEFDDYSVVRLMNASC